MRIAQVAPLSVAVPPADYGGTQRIVHVLTEELVRRGHEVTLFASGDSVTAGRLQPVCKASLYSGMLRDEVWRPEYYHAAGLSEALREAGAFDVIHSHLGCFSLPFGALSTAPMVHSLPSPLFSDELWMLERHGREPVVACSAHQLKDVEEWRREKIRVIHHAVDFEQYEFSETAGKHLAFLGRMSRQKAPDAAIAVGRALGMPVVLGGEPRFEGEETYFEEEVRPHIDGRNVIYAGPVDHQGAVDLLKNAAALLFPITADESFGIAMIEAMACGTPVVGRDLGPVPEVIDAGRTGYYAEETAALPSLVEQAMKLDRRAVREHALRRFSHHRLVDEYLDCYRGLACGKWSER
jgi:glycosyltransferase involved in cell wall biosynthesis